VAAVIKRASSLSADHTHRPDDHRRAARPRAAAARVRRRPEALRARRPADRGPLPLPRPDSASESRDPNRPTRPRPRAARRYAEAPPQCPVRALRAWIDAAAITTGPAFRRVTRTGAVSSPLTAQSVGLADHQETRPRRRARSTRVRPALPPLRLRQPSRPRRPPPHPDRRYRPPPGPTRPRRLHPRRPRPRRHRPRPLSAQDCPTTPGAAVPASTPS
jgi:hypothetical protein